MKNLIIKSLFYGVMLIITPLTMQAINSCQPLVGSPAPDFKAQAVVEGTVKNLSLADFKGKNKILIFYPADFTFICPTELFAFQDKKAEFEKRNTVLIAISVDSIKSHQDWLKAPKKEGGIQGITYPIVADTTKQIAQKYITLDPKEGRAFRGVFIIDKDNIVQAAAIYNMSIGRSIEEVLRVLDAVLFTQEHGQVCPANWEKEKEGLTATKQGLKEYLKKEQSQKPEVNQEKQ